MGESGTQTTCSEEPSTSLGQSPQVVAGAAPQGLLQGRQLEGKAALCHPAELMGQFSHLGSWRGPLPQLSVLLLKSTVSDSLC